MCEAILPKVRSEPLHYPRTNYYHRHTDTQAHRHRGSRQAGSQADT